MGLNQPGGIPKGVRIINRQEAISALRTGLPWQSLAACVLERVDPAIFEKDLRAAAVVCGRCAVKNECLVDALRLKAVDIYRAGMISDELKAAARCQPPSPLSDQSAG